MYTAANVAMRRLPGRSALSKAATRGASANEIGEALGAELRIKVTAPPVDAAANEALDALKDQLKELGMPGYRVLPWEKDDGGYLPALVRTCQNVLKDHPAYGSIAPLLQELADELGIARTRLVHLVPVLRAGLGMLDAVLELIGRENVLARLAHHLDTD